MSKQGQAAKVIKFGAARGYTPEQIATLLNELNLLAPEPAESELAQEVLRMRNELTNLQDEARAAAKIHATGPTAQRIFDALDTTINQILGNHDE